MVFYCSGFSYTRIRAGTLKLEVRRKNQSNENRNPQRVLISPDEFFSDCCPAPELDSGFVLSTWLSKRRYVGVGGCKQIVPVSERGLCNFEVQVRSKQGVLFQERVRVDENLISQHNRVQWVIKMSTLFRLTYECMFSLAKLINCTFNT